MKTQDRFPTAAITPSAIEAIVRNARAERAEVMRVALLELGASFRRLVAAFRPIRARAPRNGAWA